MADFATLDDNTRSIISARTGAATALSGDYDQDVAAGLLPNQKPTVDPLSGMVGLDQAIANKFAGIAKKDMEQIEKMNRLQAPARSMRKLQGASALSTKQYMLDRQQEMAIRQRIMAEEAQRAQILGTLIGIGGTIGGAIIGGAPGAMVGGQIGSAVGAATAPKQGQNLNNSAQQMTM